MPNLIGLDTKKINPVVKEIEANGILDAEGNLINPQFTPEGRLKVDATIEVEHIDIGNVGVLDSGDNRIDPATEETLGDVKNDLDKFKFDGDNLKVTGGSSADVVGLKDSSDVRINPAKEDGNLAGIKNDLDKFKFNNDNLKTEVENFPTEIEVSNFPAEIEVNNLPTDYAKESGGNLASVLAKLDITTSALRDAITGVSPDNRTLKDLFDKLNSILSEFDVALSTRNAEATQLLIKAKTDNLDVALSTRLNTLGQKLMADSAPVAIASDQSAIPVAVAGGDLWQADTYNGKGFSVITGDITIANTDENNFFLLKNPNASGKLVRIWESIISMTKGTGSAFSNFRIYKNPTITANGTALTINKIRSSQSASSVCSAYYNPTISARGTLIDKFVIATDHFGELIDNLGRYLEANENMLVTIEPQNSGITVTYGVRFVEE